jgi:hypothetical protein
VSAVLEAGGRRLWIASSAEGGIVGTVQLDLASQANGRHRAEVRNPSEVLYRRMGWQAAGTVPRYALSADGALHTTAFYYKLL